MKDAIDRVGRELELSEPDATVYVHLCAAGPAKASDLADALHVHRNDVYRTTERLVERGLVQSTVERPARFVAVSPDQVFDQEIRQRFATIENLRRSRTEVMGLVEQLHALAPAPPRSTYKMLHGRPAIYAQRDQMFAGARERIEVLSTHAATVHHWDVAGVIALLAERARSGVEMNLLLNTTAESVGRLASLVELPGVQVREFASALGVRFIVVDGAELLIWVVDDESDSLYAPNDVAMYTTASAFVNAQRQFVATAWHGAPQLRLDEPGQPQGQPTLT